jgi:hypothetical protein
MLSKIEQLAIELAQEVGKTEPKEVLAVNLPQQVIDVLSDLITPPALPTVPESGIMSLPEDKPYWERGIPYKK